MISKLSQEIYEKSIQLKKYDETDGWKNLNSGDIMTPITNSEIDALFVD